MAVNDNATTAATSDAQIVCNKSVLTEDYKYFTTPDKPTKQRAKHPELEHGTVKMSSNPISMD
jgi:hypothetical protein